MDRINLKEKAKKLRRQGKTYTEIQIELESRIPKSTLSGWCRGIPLPTFYKEKMKRLTAKHVEKIRPLAILANRKKQENLLNALRRKNEYLVGYLNKDIYKLLLSILYLGEGAKHKGSRVLRLASVDPKIIQLYLKFLYKCFPISKNKFRVCISCRADQDSKKLEVYWHSITKIPFPQFYPTQVDARTIGNRTKKKDYKGVCNIYYFDTKIQLELEQLADQIIEYVIKY
jgi:hypothetical protein